MARYLRITVLLIAVFALLLAGCGTVSTQLGSGNTTASGNAGIAFTGPLLNPQTLTVEQLQAIDWTTIEVNASAGAQNYAGIPMGSLLDAIGVSPEAETINFVTTGGETVSLPIADLRSCELCLLAATQGGARLDLVLPGFDLSLWAQSVASASVE